MIEAILTVAKTFSGLRDNFRKADRERRRQIAGYFLNISQCLEGIGEDLKAGATPNAKFAEMETYARELPGVIGIEIGSERADQLANALSAAAGIREGTSANMPAGSVPDGVYASIQEASGVFRGLANSIKAGDAHLIPPKLLPFAVIGGLLVLVAVGAYIGADRLRRRDDGSTTPPAQVVVTQPSGHKYPILSPSGHSYDKEFDENRTDELKLSVLGREAFLRRDYAWSEKFLNQAKRVETSKVWQSAYPFLGGSHLLLTIRQMPGKPSIR